jgi:hypothetical protein
MVKRDVKGKRIFDLEFLMVASAQQRDGNFSRGAARNRETNAPSVQRAGAGDFSSRRRNMPGGVIGKE